MKNIIIVPKDLKRELIIWLVCLVAAIGMNIYAIITYNTDWSELYSQGGYAITISCIIYAISWILRGVLFPIWYLARKKGQ